MKILFIKSTINSTKARADFGIAYLSAVLKSAGHSTSLYIWNDPKKTEFLDYRIKTFMPEIIAFSVYASSFLSTVRLSNSIRRKYPRIHQLMGGIHLIINPNEIINAPSIDSICTGEGEYAFLDYLDKYTKGNGTHLFTEGFWCRYNNKIIRNEGIPFVQNLDELPYPDRQIFVDQGLSFGDFDDNKANFLDFMFSRGCPYGCSYCSNHALRKVFGYDRYVRHLSPTKSIAWIKQDINKYACDMLNFHDDIFTLNNAWLEEFLKLYREIRLPFICHLRIGSFNMQTLRKMKSVGCFGVSIGVESGDDELRKNTLNRGMPDNKIFDAFNWCQSLGIRKSAFIMIGLPDENVWKWDKTISLLAKISPVRIILNTFYPYPGTVLHSYCRAKGYLKGKMKWNHVEGIESVLRMPSFTNRDIQFYRKNIFRMIRLKSKSNNMMKNIIKKLIYSLYLCRPESIWHIPAKIVINITRLIHGLFDSLNPDLAQ